MPRPRKEKPNHGNLYEVKITVGKRMDGTLIRKSFYSPTSKADARKQAEQYKIEKAVSEQTGQVFVEKSVTFADWAVKWLEVYKKPNTDTNTYRYTYENTVKKHLVPYFGDFKLENIATIQIQDFFNKKRSYSESMLGKMRLCLNGIFETAMQNNLCYRNPVQGVTYISNRGKAEKKVYDDAQIAVAEEKAKEDMPEVVLLLETGLRRGELLGLKWEDIDLCAGVLSVKRSATDIRQEGVRMNPPKWGSYREIPLSALAISVLKSMPRKGEFVFPGISGGAQSPNAWSKRLGIFMKKLNRQWGLPELTAHELRHTYGTRLRRRGIDIYTIQKVMGHRDIKVTSEIYVHNETDTLRERMRGIL